MRLFTVVEFPVAVPVRGEVLGTRSTMQLDRREAVLAMPRTGPVRKPFESLIAPRVAWIDVTARFVEDEMRNEVGSPWGMPAHWEEATGKVLAGSVWQAVVFLDLPGKAYRSVVQTQGDRLAPKVDSWMRRFVSWLEVGAGVDMGTDPPLHEHMNVFQPHGARVWTGVEGRRRSRAFVNPSSISLMAVSGERAISRYLWKRAVAVTNRKLNPPDDWLLLRDARRALRRGRHRQAVLDAATAAELVIANEQHQVLDRVMDSRMPSAVLGQITQVGRRLELLGLVDASFDNRVQDELMVVRHAVIHRHHRPAKSEAETAFLRAEELVRRFSPLPW